MTVDILPADTALLGPVLRAAETTYKLHNTHRAGEPSGPFRDSILHEWLNEALQGSPRHAVLAAFREGQFAGYMLLSAPEEGQSLAMVNDIWVDERQRGRRIAPALLAEAIRLQEKAGWDFLAGTIADWNTASTAAFRRAGFLDWRNHGVKDDGRRIHILVHPRKGVTLPRRRWRLPPELVAALALLLPVALLAWLTR
ncbi:N-acetyltransferase family protein [Tropicibacter sp. S64]|uniref:GNAT family N-acetyltransferase n=1 Tax=Tropicibacter sp. S64 TaxID=3415122 RepID=UPI003C7C29B9